MCHGNHYLISPSASSFVGQLFRHLNAPGKLPKLLPVWPDADIVGWVGAPGGRRDRRSACKLIIEQVQRARDLACVVRPLVAALAHKAVVVSALEVFVS